MSQDVRETQKHYVRPHDDWQCSLDLEADCGGSGLHMETTENCIPAPSLRLQRGIFAAATTALIIGLLLAFLSSPQRNEFFAPGPLSHSHAQILVNEGSSRCSSCHGAGDQTLGNWLKDAISGGRHIPVSQSQLCMECHDQSLMSKFPMHAHSMNPNQLAVLTSNTMADHSSPGFPDPRNAGGELACATCHREHHGADVNLSALTDQQCQTCHVNYIHSFEKGHPEFTSWPFQRRSSIAFDHVAHGLKHFPEKETSFDCRRCHVNDDQGNVKLVAAFELSCAQCHKQQITQTSGEGWTLFQLPMLDTEALARHGHAVGQWPGECDGDFDGTLPPAMKMLLMADPTAAAVLAQRPTDFEFSDLDPDNPRDVAEAAQLAWAIKDLLYDLSSEPDGAIQQRLEAAWNVELPKNEVKNLTYGLHPAIFLDARQRWLPELPVEIRARREMALRIPARSDLFARPSFHQEDDDTLATNPLRRLYADQLRRQESPATVAPDHATSHSGPAPQVESPQVTHYEPPPPTIQPGPQRINNQHLTTDQTEGPFHGDGPVLAVNPLAGLASGQSVEIPPPVDPVPVREDEPDTGHQYFQEAVTRLASSEHGGWYRDNARFAIAWRVAGHMDPLIKGWTDVAVRHHDSDATQTSMLFESLNSPTGVGQCRSCHTAEYTDTGAARMNWTPAYRDPNIREFTRFSHKPHDIQTSLHDCTSCHQINEMQSNKHCFASLDPHEWTSNFGPIDKATCASCHRNGGAPSGCVDCHNYHVGSRVPAER